MDTPPRRNGFFPKEPSSFATSLDPLPPVRAVGGPIIPIDETPVG
jgi:hypothetical protein